MKANRRLISILFCSVVCVLTVNVFIQSGEVNALPLEEAKAYILGNHYQDTGATNAVTSIYLNYRLWDTLFEAMILLLSAVAVIAFSWRVDDEE